MNQLVNEWIDAHEKELLSDIKELCEIPSVLAPAEGDAPFGTECKKALLAAIDLCKKYGFATRNYDNYVATADFDPSLPHTLDMLGHTDVVPAGEGWTVTEPFKIIEKDGRLYGRGTSDDKGPMLCALYAMRALKECNIPLTKGVRMIMGSDEETGSTDITKYYAVEEEAPMTFSPDAEFPLINIEKGQFRASLEKTIDLSDALPRILSLNAGIALNAVPQKATIVLEGIGATDSSLLAAIKLVDRLPLADEKMKDAISKLLVLFPYGVTDGSGVGIRMSDAESGPLTCTLDLYHIEDGKMSFAFDSRTPVMANEENCLEVAKKTIEEAGFTFSSQGMIMPHNVPADTPFVQTLLKAYTDVTGLEGKAVAIGGGTYVHELKNGVAFGAVLPDIDTHMHGADEFMDIKNINLATKVFAEAIMQLCM